MKRKIYLLTEERYLNPEPKSDYVKNILKEDQLLSKALEKLGYDAKRVAWDGSEPPPKGSYAIFRSTWNYYEKIDQFRQWLAAMADEVHLINSPATITWNLNKEYLFDLAKAGVNIVETLFIEKHTELNLSKITQAKGWNKIVVKPAISATASNTFKLEGEEIKAFESEFHTLNNKEKFLIQEFQENVVKQGEVSLIYINGVFVQAVLKKAKAGDYRVQDDFGGSVHEYKAKAEQITLGEKAIQTCQVRPVYGRVDILLNNKKEWVVSELELIEPELWLRLKPESAVLLAEAIHDQVSSSLPATS